MFSQQKAKPTTQKASGAKKLVNGPKGGQKRQDPIDLSLPPTLNDTQSKEDIKTFITPTSGDFVVDGIDADGQIAE
jgi:hypothetical protein